MEVLSHHIVYDPVQVVMPEISTMDALTVSYNFSSETETYLHLLRRCCNAAVEHLLWEQSLASPLKMFQVLGARNHLSLVGIYLTPPAGQRRQF